jgi:transposase
MVDTAVKAGKRAKRLNYPFDFKKRLARAACAPDVSVSQLALDHEINVNMLFKWRRQYRAGLFDVAVEPARLLRASLVDEHPVATPPSISAGSPQE